MSLTIHRHLKLDLDGASLVDNWHALNGMSGEASCGAAIKADGYGLGAREVAVRLYAAGCRDFFVATWEEAIEIAPSVGEASVTVLNGVLEDDMSVAVESRAKPMLNSVVQVARWKATGLPCDLMVDTGMNRLGVSPCELGEIAGFGLDVDLLASHLASADEDSSQNDDQLAVYRIALGTLPHQRKSLANSAGIALGSDYHFDLTRPGLSLYGGIPRNQFEGKIAPVATIRAQILQTRELSAGDKVGYNATFIAEGPMVVGTISIGYADGYLRGFSGRGFFYANDEALPVLGRVSMDLVALDLSNIPDIGEGEWVELPLDLPLLAKQSGLSQYEVLTSLDRRFERIWSD